MWCTLCRARGGRCGAHYAELEEADVMHTMQSLRRPMRCTLCRARGGRCGAHYAQRVQSCEDEAADAHFEYTASYIAREEDNYPNR
ncbi:hypothetical protein PoB_007401000 [Plakobranchus ocellatus]|uniref:Uncharacterized protein n=1 Tax=Plakobranchus ocellatus TaxID=259542 RepID=A0AAV4DTY9_9GAST|nr:hypothetical protein PoB_007401000 [Plakobranchus ocellatus]